MLTKRQGQIIDAINSYTTIHGYAPSVRDVAAYVGLSSSSTVYGHLQRMKEKGLVNWEAGQARTMTLL